ncbi:MAG TPA: rhomboid family intramembrane serine protease [Gemmataceae bacterium]|nr:rhomboid family intramembrane serine protease [Gemmataceae bacterium]
MSPFEAILRQIAAVAPQPWYPRAFAKERGVELGGLTYLLEHLWLDRLIRNTPPVEGVGAGVVLSPEGERVLQDPEALQRLREGRPLTEGDRGGLVREALRRSATPVVTRLMVALNVLAFGYGAYLAWGRAALRNYLSGFSVGPRGLIGLPGLLDILHQTGSVTGADVLAGQWWRLLSSAFVHLGLIHLGMNMFILYRGGPMIEQMWGRLRYLAIYLISAWLGGCLAIAYGPRVLYQGASGAICGLLAAEAVWIVLNRRYLPGSVLRRARSAIFINTLLLVGISLVGGVSGWGHGGGALGGALAAVLLNFQRFGPSPWRWLALPVVAALPALGVYAVQHQRAVNPQWQALGKAVAEVNQQQAAEMEERDFDAAYNRQAEELLEQAHKYYKQHVERLRDMSPTRRPQAEVDKALREVPEQRRKLAPLIERLSKAGPFQSARLERKRQQALEFARDLDKDLRQGAEELRQGPAKAEQARREAAEEAAREKFGQTYLRRIRQATRTADDAFHQRSQPLLEQPPGRRVPVTVEKALKALADGRPALDKLAAELDKGGPSPFELVETARHKAVEYLKAYSQLLGLAERALRAGDRWTEKDEAALQQQVKAVDKLRGEWNSLVE